MSLFACGCTGRNPGDDYEAGPTACIAHPRVIRDIKRQIARNRILSVADARIATLAGMLNIPAVGRTGFNDGVIYPPADIGGPAMAALAGRQPAMRFALSPPTGKRTLNCLVLRVDFSDDTGSAPASQFAKLLFDQTNPNSMTTFYKEMSFGTLTITGTVTDGFARTTRTPSTPTARAEPAAPSRRTRPGSCRRFCRNIVGPIRWRRSMPTATASSTGCA
jgi:immune inhibitor A